MDQETLETNAQSGAGRRRPLLAALLPLLPAALKYRVRIAVALVALAIAAGATLVIPLAVRRVIDHGFEASQSDTITLYFTALMGVVLVFAAASAVRFYCVMTLGERVVADVRANVFDHLTRLDQAFFDTARSGELVSRITADTTQLKSAFGSSASVALRNVFLFLGATVMMVLTSTKLSALVLIAIPLIVLPLVGSGRSVRKRSRAAQDALAETAAFATEQIGAARTMQSFGAEIRTRENFTKATEDSFRAAREFLVARSALTGIAIFLIFASIIAVLWLGARDVAAGDMSAGRLSQFLIYAMLAAGGLSQLSDVFGEFSQAAGAAGRINELLQTAPQVREAANPVPLPRPALGTLAFDAVTFAYPSRPDETALGPLTFSIKAGERVAIVGPSGAGKTTIIQLILRFYDASAGSVRVDGLDVREVGLTELRQRMALVPQDPVIFATSVSDNIRYAKPDASDADIRRAAELAAADGFIRELDKGYETPLGERGVMLSGGQRQRIAIARAILKDAPILLLDEATSALDAESEAAVQTALDRLMEGRTSVVIAHRLATIRKANRILVLSNGQIVEEGSHDALMQQNGLYARLARLQFDAGGLALAAE